MRWLSRNAGRHGLHEGVVRAARQGLPTHSRLYYAVAKGPSGYGRCIGRNAGRTGSLQGRYVPAAELETRGPCGAEAPTGARSPGRGRRA